MRRAPVTPPGNNELFLTGKLTSMLPKALIFFFKVFSLVSADPAGGPSSPEG